MNNWIESFANGEDFKDLLRENGVLFASQKYSYGGGYFDVDTYRGLTMAVHQWTENTVTLTSLSFDGNAYSGTLQFTFKDNFGLDSGDLDQGYLAGFRSWYILQHYDQYAGNNRPFKTAVTIDYTFSGSLLE